MKSPTRVFTILVICSLLASGCGAAVPATPALVQPTVSVSTPASSPSTVAPVKGMITIRTKINFNVWPRRGTFEVLEGASLLGCSGGSFVDTPVDPIIQKLLTCESGTRSGTFTIEFTAEESNPGPGDENGPWNMAASTEDFVGLAGRGDFSVVHNEETAWGVETLTGQIEYSP